jgi:hypothetical protein
MSRAHSVEEVEGRPPKSPPSGASDSDHFARDPPCLCPVISGTEGDIVSRALATLLAALSHWSDRGPCRGNAGTCAASRIATPLSSRRSAGRR